MATDLERILARLERLEAENAALRREMHGTLGVASSVAAAAVSRRQLLRRAGVTVLGVGMVAASAATLGRAEPVSATDGDPIVIGTFQEGIATTSLTNTTDDEDVFAATSVRGGTGLTGSSQGGNGVLGLSVTGPALTGRGARGGDFTGTKAAIVLRPSPQAGHPHKGTAGELLVDKAHRLWFCKGGTSWHQLA